MFEEGDISYVNAIDESFKIVFTGANFVTRNRSVRKDWEHND